MTNPFSASICHIDLGAIQRNFQRLGQAATLMPVVKSDAYGHGLKEVGASLVKAGAMQFAVGLPQEGELLRQSGFTGTIVPLLGCLGRDDWDLAIHHALTPIIGNFQDIDLASARLANFPGQTLKIAIKCDTGMNRLGFNLEEAYAACEAISQTAALEPVLLLSHLACADMPEECSYTENQFAIFEQFYEVAKGWFPAIKGSLGNSAGALQKPSYDILRPGLALYGYSPFAETSALEPAMAFSTPIIHIKDLPAGQSVSYGRIFKTRRPTRLAVTACGYANGLPRNLSGRFSMLVNGKRSPQIGRICMGMTMLDITDAGEVKTGDRAWLMGGQGNTGTKGITAQELADLAGTIPYELLCLFGSLNTRHYS